MTGLFLLLVLGVWAWLSWWLADRLARAFALGHARMAARVALFVCLLPIPLADEIYSRPAFQRLCLANADVAVSGSNLSGRTVWFTGTTSTARKVGLLQGVELRWNFVQANTQAPAFQYSTFTAQGGRMMHLLGISETHAPLLFEGHCQPRNLEDQLRRLNVVVVDKPH